MTLEVHTVDLRARDGISPVLRQVSGSAQTMARDVDMAAETGRRGFDRWSAAGAAFGAAAATAGGILSDFARAAAEDEAVFARLEQAIDNTGRSFEEYSTQVNRAIERGEDLAFADDQVADALARLTTQTGSADAALENIGLAMDLARTRGMDLSSAAELVGKVHEGNIGILSRYGIAVQEGATATEALALLQTRVAGQAQMYSETDAGRVDRYRNAIDNLTESLGAHTGEVQALLMMAPGLSAMYTSLGGIVGAMGGASTLGPLAVLAGVGIAGYATYSQITDPYGGGIGNQIIQGAGYGAGSVLSLMGQDPRFGLLGTAGDWLKDATNDQGQITDMVQLAKTLFYIPPGADMGDGDKWAIGRFRQAGIFPLVGENSTSGWANYLNAQAAALNMTPEQYVTMMMANQTTLVQDPLSGQYGYADQIATLQGARKFAAMGGYAGYVAGTSGIGLGYVPTPPVDRGGLTYFDGTPKNPLRSEQPFGATYDQYGSAGIAMGSLVTGAPQFDAQTAGIIDANKMAAYTAQLEAMYPAYIGLMEGVNSANDATMAFKATQDGLLSTQAIYSGQLSEYSQQQNALTAAYDILQERQQNGEALTKEEQQLLANYPALYERVTGGVEDATVAQGLLAAQYIENMSKGDQLNETLAGNTAETGNLVEAIELLILSLNGVPEEVQTRILVNNIDYAISSVDTFAQLLNGLPDSKTVAVYYQAYGDYVPGMVGSPFGMATGGVVPTAATGRMTDSRYTLVGENGPELVALPGGSLVTPYGASREASRGRGGITINGPINVYANDPNEFVDALRSRGLAEAWS